MKSADYASSQYMTKKESFSLFLSAKEKDIKVDAKIDWEARKKAWLEYLNALYDLFSGCLMDFQHKGKLKVSKDSIEIIEGNIGPYQADRMIIEFADEKIILKPIGTILIGAMGRVDMSGKYGSVKIVLVDSRMKGIRDQIRISVVEGDSLPPKKPDSNIEKAVNWEWRFVSAPPASLYQPVNDETIYSVIMELSNGYKHA